MNSREHLMDSTSITLSVMQLLSIINSLIRGNEKRYKGAKPYMHQVRTKAEEHCTHAAASHTLQKRPCPCGMRRYVLLSDETNMLN
jgi:hypothetical protein